MFKREIVAVDIEQEGDPVRFDTDESPRLVPFRGAPREAGVRKDRTVTAGTPRVSTTALRPPRHHLEAAAKRLGLSPRAEIVAYASSGLAPGS
jgi:acetyl-CoA acetyltransferase